MGPGQVTNIDDHIKEVNWVKRMSKAGAPYGQLQIRMENGLDMDLMIDRPYGQIIDMLISNDKPK